MPLNVHPVFPSPELAVTHILVVSDLARSKAWYLDVLGATLYGEYGGTSVVLELGTAWLLIVTGGGPTDDKPDVTLAPPADPTVRDNLFTMRVDDCQAAYDELRGRGAVVPDAAGHAWRRDALLLPRPGWPPVRDQRVPTGLERLCCF